MHGVGGILGPLIDIHLFLELNFFLISVKNLLDFLKVENTGENSLLINIILRICLVLSNKILSSHMCQCLYISMALYFVQKLEELEAF